MIEAICYGWWEWIADVQIEYRHPVLLCSYFLLAFKIIVISELIHDKSDILIKPVAVTHIAFTVPNHEILLTLAEFAGIIIV